MARAERCLDALDRAFIEQSGFVETARLSVDCGQVADRSENTKVIRLERLLRDGEGAHQHWLGLAIALQLVVGLAEREQLPFGIAGTSRLQRSDPALEIWHRLGVAIELNIRRD